MRFSVRLPGSLPQPFMTRVLPGSPITLFGDLRAVGL